VFDRLPVAIQVGVYTFRAYRFYIHAPLDQSSHSDDHLSDLTATGKTGDASVSAQRSPPDDRHSDPSSCSNGDGYPYPISLSDSSTGSNGDGCPQSVSLSDPSSCSNGDGYPYPVSLSGAPRSTNPGDDYS
jgi:hypothetical protein